MLVVDAFAVRCSGTTSRLTRHPPALYSDPFDSFCGAFFAAPHDPKLAPPMANPKRKQSKRRSANRRAANAFRAPEFAKDPTDGSMFRPHRVNPANGMYRGRQVLNVEV
jgi:large subunit ribosomal protein L32